MLVPGCRAAQVIDQCVQSVDFGGRQDERLIAAAAPPGRAQLYLVDSLAHVKLSPAGLIDTLVLWRAVYLILERRDAAPPPEPSPDRAFPCPALGAATAAYGDGLAA